MKYTQSSKEDVATMFDLSRGLTSGGTWASLLGMGANDERLWLEFNTGFVLSFIVDKNGSRVNVMDVRTLKEAGAWEKIRNPPAKKK